MTRIRKDTPEMRRAGCVLASGSLAVVRDCVAESWVREVFDKKTLKQQLAGEVWTTFFTMSCSDRKGGHGRMITRLRPLTNETVHGLLVLLRKERCGTAGVLGDGTVNSMLRKKTQEKAETDDNIKTR